MTNPGPEKNQNPPPSGSTASQVHQLKQRQDVKKALNQASRTKAADEPAQAKSGGAMLVVYIFVLILLAAAYYFLHRNGFVFEAGALDSFVRRAVLGGIGILVIAIVFNGVDTLLIERIEDAAAKYNI